MPFALRLSLATGRTLAELLGCARPGDAMSSAEFAVWGEWYGTRGFDADRIEWATAKAGAAVANQWGAKYDPADLIPQFQATDRRAKLAKIRAWMQSRG